MQPIYVNFSGGTVAHLHCLKSKSWKSLSAVAAVTCSAAGCEEKSWCEETNPVLISRDTRSTPSQEGRNLDSVEFDADFSITLVRWDLTSVKENMAAAFVYWSLKLTVLIFPPYLRSGFMVIFKTLWSGFYPLKTIWLNIAIAAIYCWFQLKMLERKKLKKKKTLLLLRHDNCF